MCVFAKAFVSLLNAVTVLISDPDWIFIVLDTFSRQVKCLGENEGCTVEGSFQLPNDVKDVSGCCVGPKESNVQSLYLTL